MAVSEPERHELYRTFAKIIGNEKADTLMRLLPPTGWGEVATRRDFEAFQAVTGRDFEAFQAVTGRDFEAFREAMRRDFQAFQEAMRRDFGAYQEQTQRSFESLQTAFHAHEEASKKEHQLMESRLREQIMRTALTVNIPTILAAVGLTFAASRLG